MSKSKLVKTVILGLSIYLILIFVWGYLHFCFSSIKFPNDKQQPTLWDCIYFSSTTFGTIGYGDITPNGFTGQLLVILQAIVSIIYVGIFSGYMAFQFLKRPNNIFITKHLLLRPLNNDILFSLRVGNRGKEMAECKLEIGFTQINNDIKHTYYKKEIQYSLLERSWLPAINLNKSENSDFLSALKLLYNNPNNTMLRIVINGIDLNSGENVAFYKYFKFNDIKIAGKFKDVYNWEGLERTKPQWKYFNQNEAVTDEQIKKVVSFLRQ